MPLATVRPTEGEASDVTVFSDAWAIHPSTNDFYILSLVGTSTGVRNVHDALQHGARVRLTVNEQQRYEVRAAVRTIRTRWGRLPSGAAHALIVAEPADDHRQNGSRLVLAPSSETLAAAVYQELVEARALMGFPDWAAWLTRELEEATHLVRLTGPIAATVLKLTEAELDAVVQRGLAQAHLRFPAVA